MKINKKMIFFIGALGGLLYGYDMGGYFRCITLFKG